MDKLIDVDKAASHVMKVVDALTPVAKQAYEIGLLTLRIDAAQEILSAVVLLVICALVLRRVVADYRAARTKAAKPENARNWYSDSPSDHLPGEGMLHFIGGVCAFCGAALGLVMVLNIWTWTKLFAPELWLARMAIEKIIN